MNDDQQVDANGTFMVLMHLKDINAMKYLTFTCDGNTNLRSHSIDVYHPLLPEFLLRC